MRGLVRIEWAADPRAEIEVRRIHPATGEDGHPAGEHHLAGSDRHQDFRGAARRRIAEDNDGGGGYAVGPGLDCLSHRSVVTRAAQLAKRKGKCGVSGCFTLSDAAKFAFTIANGKKAPSMGDWHGACTVRCIRSVFVGVPPSAPERIKGPPGSPPGGPYPF